MDLTLRNERRWKTLIRGFKVKIESPKFNFLNGHIYYDGRSAQCSYHIRMTVGDPPFAKSAVDKYSHIVKKLNEKEIKAFKIIGMDRKLFSRLKSNPLTRVSLKCLTQMAYAQGCFTHELVHEKPNLEITYDFDNFLCKELGYHPLLERAEEHNRIFGSKEQDKVATYDGDIFLDHLQRQHLEIAACYYAHQHLSRERISSAVEKARSCNADFTAAMLSVTSPNLISQPHKIKNHQTRALQLHKQIHHLLIPNEFSGRLDHLYEKTIAYFHISYLPSARLLAESGKIALPTANAQRIDHNQHIEAFENIKSRAGLEHILRLLNRKYELQRQRYQKLLDLIKSEPEF